MNPYIYRFLTNEYPPEQRFEAWRDEVNAIFTVDIDKSVSPGFNYALTTGYLGSVLIGCGSWAGERQPVSYAVRRSTQMARQDGLDHLYVCLGMTHSISGYAARTPLNAESSKIYVLDLARELDSQIVAGDTVILTIARDLLEPRIRAANLHGAVLQGPISTLLADHMLALRRQLPHFAPADLPYVEQATLAMVSAALLPSLDTFAAAETEINEALLTRVRRYIDANLTSPDLAPLQICRDVGISRAQLYRLFSRESGVAAYIQQRRLVKIRQIVEGAKGGAQRLSTLAFRYGFKSESHFSRSFRQAFGCSPSEARERAAAMRASSKESRSHAQPQPGSLRDVLGNLDSRDK
ncbi:helix-turn-helix domain-containing protein [Paraburkholderia jirisanensis]